MSEDKLAEIEKRVMVRNKPSDNVWFVLNSERDILDLIAEVRRLREALKPFASGGEWGAVKAWIVNGAPTREDGIAAAKRITHMNVVADNAIYEGAA